MTNILSNWKGTIELNGNQIDNSFDFSNVSGALHLVLRPESFRKPIEKTEEVQTASNKITDVSGTYRITVKQYMTKKASPEFDFMKVWNHDCPMPLRTMTGIIDKETKGMYHMILHGQGEQTIHCMRCGRELTNPISRHYGIGPECIAKIGLAYDINEVDSIKRALVDVKWEGWCPKSAVIDKEEL